MASISSHTSTPSATGADVHENAHVVLPKREHERLLEVEARSALTEAGASDGLWHWNLETAVVHYSRRWKAILGHDDGELDAKPAEWLDRVHPDDLPRVQRAIDACVSGTCATLESEHRLRHKSGGYRWVLARGLASRDNGPRPMRLAGSITDITDGKVVDALTGLPNRVLLGSRLQTQHARSKPGTQFALLFLDLDNFKEVNDSLGHQAGDELLKTVAQRIEQSLRATDVVGRAGQAGVKVPEHTLARIGGDEFVILLQDIPGPLEATRVAERIQQALAVPIPIAGTDVVTTASIGISVNATSLVQPDDAVRDADAAMYRAKALGRGRYEIFDAEMREEVRQRQQLDADLRLGIERHEFLPYYHPIVDLRSGQLVGFEALLRWQHPSRGIVLPSEFVPLIETTGMVLPIGRRFIEDVCLQMQTWQGRYRTPHPLTVTINFATRQILEAGLVDRLIDVLEECALWPEQVVVEVNESVTIGNVVEAAGVFRRLRAAGIRVMLDDFGTGYSSLTSLHELPIAGLKLDRTFLAIDETHPGLVAAVVALASRLNLTVTAEGIETQDQCGRLSALGCQFGQGYLFARPLDATAAGALIQTQPTWLTGAPGLKAEA